MIQLPDEHKVLVADDEPDVFSLTRISLRGLKYRDRSVKLSQASSGEEAVQFMKDNPDTAAILLDVVMESSTAGLDACRAIREDLGNRLVRILLRTGQPGVAPEKQAIDEYDIDGYLLKTELTTTRLYAAVRTAIKAFEELVELERHRSLLHFIHDATVQLHSFEDVDVTLSRVLAMCSTITGATLAVLSLQTFDNEGDAQNRFLHLSSDPEKGEEDARAIEEKVKSAGTPSSEPGKFDDGLLIPILLHRELGYGWIYLAVETADAAVMEVLPVIASQVSNSLYSSVAHNMLESREGPFYDSMTV